MSDIVALKAVSSAFAFSPAYCFGSDVIAPAACAGDGAGVGGSMAALLGSDCVQSPAHSLVPLTVPTSLQPIGAFGLT